MFNLLLIILFWISIQTDGSSAQTGTNSCQTPDQKSGICININNCTVLLNLLVTQSNNPQVRSHLKASRCGFEGQTPMVCCPQLNRNLDNTTPRNQNQNNRSSGKLPKSPNCGFSNVTIPRIVNGVPAKLDYFLRWFLHGGHWPLVIEFKECKGEFPWIAALGYRNSKNPQMPKWLCGGSLITNKHILTAAHCVYNRPDLYIARLGDLDLYSDDDGANPVTIPLIKAKIHENYSPTKYTNDIAILTLKQTPNNPTVWPICLPVSQPYRSMTYLNFSPTLAGWGSITFNGPSSPALQEIFVPVMNNEICKRAFGRQATIDDKIICAGSMNGDKDACGGDSGGPLMNQINEGTNYRVYEIGIVSYGFRCAEPGYPGVYTRVTAFIDWIQNNLD